MYKKIFLVGFATCIYLFCMGANAEILASSYAVYERTKGSDKVLYVVPSESILILHGDIAIPIIYYEDGPAFTGTLYANGSLGSLSKMAEGTNAKTIEKMCVSSGYVCKESTYKFFDGDFNGDGQKDLLLQGKTDSSIVLVVSKSGVLLSSESLGLIIRSDRYDISVEDTNGDGRKDINVYKSGEYIRTLLAGDDGLFSEENGSDDIATINTTWNLFLNAMLANDRNNMNKYIDVRSREKFGQVFDVLGEEVAEVAAQVRTQKPYFISGDVAIFLLEKQGDDGGTYIHTVTYRRQSDGSWKLHQL
ncbi:FG-GAP repeat domain-containing protein [Microbulbifer sp. DLAB2-AA]|uniref:FG-GAP repeat domain-containing protein n=1 Tax=Microbulbifer sp. DLAB2-AA TaxID=3243394 RepID=UPI00403973AB